MPCEWGEANLTLNDLGEILSDTPDLCDEVPQESIVGYPTRPLYREIASVLVMWNNMR